DLANTFYQSQAPWSYLKSGEEADLQQARAIVATCAECVRLVAIALKPVVPRYAAAVEAQLGIGPLSLASLDDAVGAHTTISGVDKIYLRPEQEDFYKLVIGDGDAPSDTDASSSKATGLDVERRPLKDTAQYEDFVKLDLRVG